MRLRKAEFTTNFCFERRLPSVPDDIRIIIESRTRHINFVGVRTETAEEEDFLIVRVDNSSLWNSDDLDSSHSTVCIIIHIELGASRVQIIRGSKPCSVDRIGVVL